MSMIGSNAPTSATTKGEADAAENCQRINKSVITANEERVTLVKSGKCNKSIGTKTRIDVNPSFVPSNDSNQQVIQCLGLSLDLPRRFCSCH